jgi:hypothetical protein
MTNDATGNEDAAADYGVTQAELERFIERLDNQAQEDARNGRLVRYTGNLKDLLGDP